MVNFKRVVLELHFHEFLKSWKHQIQQFKEDILFLINLVNYDIYYRKLSAEFSVFQVFGYLLPTLAGQVPDPALCYVSCFAVGTPPFSSPLETSADPSNHLTIQPSFISIAGTDTATRHVFTLEIFIRNGNWIDIIYFNQLIP